MKLTITQVDAFTAEPFGGNPAAVCLLPDPADADVDAAGGSRDEPVGDRLPGPPG